MKNMAINRCSIICEHHVYNWSVSAPKIMSEKNLFLLDVKILIYFHLFQCKFRILTCQNSFKKTVIFVAGEGLVRVNLTRKKDIYFHNRNNGVSCGDCAVRKREENVWLGSREIGGKPWRIYKRAYRACNNA